ncbi:hypothetical protein FDJ06_gp274 [Pseudomonas phage SL2]|uniref:PHIKZ078 n=2 Tax=Phikzvirus TaxID=680115 RepID=Q8SD84_BPDPK|nr:PHIKZ078 [Pseudomonas phage phiKZ]YP_009619814.1 hypothetical protein FDJ06_gp274 [Pseudomonas phage SL2]AAL82979.1 PHIKZ078 [Pseudomonas phage phiKZ]ATN94851.1 hypothetical protein SL2_274 [Pseudomonas phage SL2]
MSNKAKEPTLTKEQEKTLRLFERAVGASAAAADHILNRDGWDVVNVLAGSVGKRILQTEVFINPVINKINEIIPTLSDPTGFQKNLQTVIADLNRLTKIISVLYVQHQGKVGPANNEDELKLISELVTKYTGIEGAIERGIDGVILAMIGTLREAGWDEKLIQQ